MLGETFTPWIFSQDNYSCSLSQCSLQYTFTETELHRLKKNENKKYIRPALSFGGGKYEQQCAEDKRLSHTFTPLTSMQRVYLVLIYLLMCFLSADTKPE